ncbi:hypothetical protein VCHENC02_0557A, partial [Vibrio harveyi]
MRCSHLNRALAAILFNLITLGNG